MELTVQINCRNVCEIEGYATDIKSHVESKEGFGERHVLEFKLNHINQYTSDPRLKKKQVFTTPFKVIAYKNRAIEVEKWLKPFMLVTVQGKARLTKGGFTLIAAFVECTQPMLAKIDIDKKEGEE